MKAAPSSWCSTAYGCFGRKSRGSRLTRGVPSLVQPIDTEQIIDRPGAAEGEQAISGHEYGVGRRRHQTLSVRPADPDHHHSALAQPRLHQFLADVGAGRGDLEVGQLELVAALIGNFQEVFDARVQ